MDKQLALAPKDRAEQFLRRLQRAVSCRKLRDMEPSKPVQSEKPSENFVAAKRKIIAVPKSELLRREADYKEPRKFEENGLNSR